MVLVDTSVWISHLRDGNKDLESLLNEDKVICHPMIIGELACGNIKNRNEILSLLQTLPPAKEATHKEVLAFIDKKKLYGKGIGFIDVHLLASALISDIALWTLDRKLDNEATKLKINYKK